MIKKFNQYKMQEVDQQEIKAGADIVCGCACYYEGTPGGSTTEANAFANKKLGITSPKGDIKVGEIIYE